MIVGLFQDRKTFIFANENLETHPTSLILSKLAKSTGGRGGGENAHLKVEAL